MGDLSIRKAIWAAPGRTALSDDDIAGICSALGLNPKMMMSDLRSLLADAACDDDSCEDCQVTARPADVQRQTEGESDDRDRS